MFFSKKLSESSVKNIITVNAYAGKYYIFKNNIFKPLNKLKYNTLNFNASYLSNKDVIHTTISLSRSIAEEDIADILDIKAYEELGLDQATEYVISSREVESFGEEREFNIFVAEPHVLEELYLPIKKQTKYIDLLVPAPLLYTVLYKKEILQENGTHCFIYFTKKDAFVTLYKDGKFLYSKSIGFSLEQIYDKYCELFGEKVDEKEFFSILKSEGLKASNNKYQENLIKIFSEVFSTINDIIIYAKRAFQIEMIDQVYIGSVQGPIVGLNEYSQNYLSSESVDLNFNYHVDSDEWYTDQLQYMMLLSVFDYLEDETSIVNLTMFPRPPSFANRASGQFLIATFAAIFVGLLYPLLYLTGSYANDAKIYALNIENKKLQKETDKYKKILGAKKKEIEIQDAKIDKLATQYNGKTKTLTAIYDKKVNYRLKSEMFYTIAKEVRKFDMNVEMISSKDDVLSVFLVSESDRKITELIKYISDVHFDEISQIDIKLIEKNVENSYFKGLLRIELK